MERDAYDYYELYINNEIFHSFQHFFHLFINDVMRTHNLNPENQHDRLEFFNNYDDRYRDYTAQDYYRYLEYSIRLYMQTDPYFREHGDDTYTPGIRMRRHLRNNSHRRDRGLR